MRTARSAKPSAASILSSRCGSSECFCSGACVEEIHMKKTKKPMRPFNSQWLSVSYDSLPHISATVLQATRRSQNYRRNRLARWRIRNLRSGYEIQVSSGLGEACFGGG